MANLFLIFLLRVLGNTLKQENKWELQMLEKIFKEVTN